MSEILDLLLSLPNPLPIDGSEADARALIIDPLLTSAGWAAGDVKREPYAGWEESRGFIDYLLLQGGRPMMVVEAKKTGRSFQLPANLTSQRVTSFKKIRRIASPDLKEALEQCLRYTQHTGAPYACATNGSDWIFFKPSHSFRSLPDARVVIFNGIDQVAKRIDEFLDLFSFEGLQEGRAEKELLGREIQKPQFAKRLQDAFPYHDDPSIEEEEYSNLLDQLLRHYVVELTSELDFEECYFPVKANRTTLRTLDDLIAGRVEALRGVSQKSPNEFNEGLLATPLLQNHPSGRTVVLHGEVGVGKSSFLRHCELQLREAGKLSQAVWSRVDLLPFQDRQFSAEERGSMLSLICKCIQDEVSSS
jgi:predicted type IV restriction endonuclease